MREMTVGEAIAAFLECPENYFYDRSGDFYTWLPEIYLKANKTFLPNIYAQYSGFPLAFVHDIELFETFASIGHIAVESDLTERGMGSALAHSMARNLSFRFGINDIQFNQRRMPGKMEAYQVFFNKIGATEIPGKNYSWHWNYNNYVTFDH